MLCRNAEHCKDGHELKETILGVCNERQDDWAQKVQIQIQGAISDLCAVDARYHKNCYSLFMNSLAVQYVGGSPNKEQLLDQAFEDAVAVIRQAPSVIRNTIELFHQYLSNDGNILTNKSLLKKLSHTFGSELLILCSPGITNIVCSG